MSNQSGSNSNSPHDSLSPLDDCGRYDFKEQDTMAASVRRFSFESSANEEAVFHYNQVEQEPHLTCQEFETKHEVATTGLPSTKACSPRSTLIIRNQRPSDLSLTKTNGLTTISLVELKRCIGDARTDPYAAIVQVPRPKASHLPKTPDTPSPFPYVMGNKPSSEAESPAPDNDNASDQSVVRRPGQVPRKSSTNFFKRFDSQTPLPRQLTGTVIHVQQSRSPVPSDGVNDESDESTADPTADPPLNSYHSLDQSQDVVPPHSASTVTITAEKAWQPPSVSTTVRDLRIEDLSDFKAKSRLPHKASKSESSLQQKWAPHRPAALSPSIPAPSPLPEDSPHKYGLKDRSETPGMPEPEEISVVKVQRRSSGLDIFNEAKSLQSASSFLNGLSTSRRRAESMQLGNDASTWTVTSQETTRPYSTSRLQSRQTSSRPAAQTTYSSERCRGHNFKPSGFAYSRPLGMAQIKCYRNHARLTLSRNKKASVECAVCHIDDDADHYSCSWCAIRMCRFCRKDFAERGMTALKERIKNAELGNPSPSSSSDSLDGLRRERKSYT